MGRGWSRDEAIRVLERPARRSSEDPELLWDRLGLSAGQTVVDVGAGTGFFSVPAARRVGTSGRVYAVDISPELVRWLRERSVQERLPQLAAVRSRREAIPLGSGRADWVLLANVLHDVPEATVHEAVRLLRPEGRLANVDWSPTRTPHGPPLSVRLTPAQAAARLEAHGLEVVDRFPFGPWHYALVCHRVPVRPGGGGAPGGRRAPHRKTRGHPSRKPRQRSGAAR